MPTATASSSVRDEALRRLGAGRDHEFVALALPHLHAAVDDEYIRLMLVRSYLRLGLITSAKELLDDAPPGAAAAELANLQASLAAVADAPIPWSRFAGQFDANLAALAPRFDVSPIRSAWTAHAGEYQLYRDRMGNDQIRELHQAGGWMWYPVLADHAAVENGRALPEAGAGTMPLPLVFEGVGLGAYFERVYRATLNTFLGYSCALFVVEPQAQRLALALHLRNWRDLLADPRVLVFAGPDCFDSLRAAWDKDWDLPFPSQVITTGSRPGHGVRTIDVVRAAAARREREIQESSRRLEEQYANRSPAYWARRFEESLAGRGESLRILTAVSTHTTFLQHSLRDAKRALESLGHRVLLLTEQTPFGIVGPRSYHRAIEEFEPDLFLVLDHFRLEFRGLIPGNLPVLTWDQDQLPHVVTRENLRGVAAHDFVAGCSKPRCVALGLDPRQCLYARVPTCPEQFGGDPLTDDEVARYGCDVSYVSHASQTPTQFHEQELGQYRDPPLQKLLNCLYELMPQALAEWPVTDGFVTTHLLDTAASRVGIRVLNEQLRTRIEGWYIWRLADRIFRHEALEWAAHWARERGRTLRIYGNGWDRHPTLAPFAAGPATNGRELLCIYRASRINLQLIPAGFIHQRALDGLAAGGFFLSRKVPRDTQGRVLRELNARITALGIDNLAALQRCDDVGLRRLLLAYVGPWLRHGARSAVDLYTLIRVNAELLHPDEVFPDFPAIVFDSQADLAAKADAFLTDDDARQGVAKRMRQVVIESFSYRATMDQFLHRMAKYLRDQVGAVSA